MKRQLDIFEGGEPEGAKGKAKASPKRKRATPKRAREVKKAPMIIDSYAHGTRNSELGTRGQRVDVRPATSESRIPNPESRETPNVLTVSQITGYIKANLETSFSDIWVTGEVTNFKGRKGPHLYFGLKDEKSQINAIIFGAGNGRLPFDLEDGLKLVCRGRINVYEPRGSYSLIVDPDHCEPEGIGALKLAFEQLKKKLAAEGLFDEARKRPIPYLPRRIGIVTAPQGAAVRDMINVLTRRFPNVEILIHPSRVQGEGAAAEIAQAIANLNRLGGLDVMIVGRGGGSMEDLWCFNEEIVARAIADSKIPVISAVGHEIDFTIADFVADLRAATPSAAAELAIPVRADLLATIRDSRARLANGLQRRLPDLLQRVDAARQRLIYSLGVKVKHIEQHLAKLASNLDHLSPLGVLAKGYAVVEAPDGKAVRDAKRLKTGDDLGLRFHKGSARAKVTKIN